MRLRQVALVAADLDAVVARLCATLALEVSYRDPGVEIFGLRNAVMPIGDTFLEVVSPMTGDTTAGRYLERRGGDGGYMVMIQSDDFAADRSRFDALGIRMVWSIELDDIRGMHLHPRDTGGAILSFDQPVPEEDWRWAGPEWRGHRGGHGATEIVAVELQSDEPQRLAQRWGEIVGRTAVESGGAWAIELDRGRIRFVASEDQRGEGVSGFDVLVDDLNALRERAARAGALRPDGALDLCGTRVRLVARVNA